MFSFLFFSYRRFICINPERGTKATTEKVVSKKTGKLVQKKPVSVNPQVAILLKKNSRHSLVQSCQPSRFECEGHAISPLNTPHATLAISHSHLHTFHLSRKLQESPWIYTSSRSMFTVLYTFIYISVVRRCRLPKRTDLQANKASRIEAFLA